MGCTPTCPSTVVITLSDGTTASATVESGAASQASSTWAFYANGPSATSILGVPILPGGSVLLFRAEYGAGGKLVRYFDNQKFAPDSFGSQVFFDGKPHAMTMPNLMYSAESYGVEHGTAIANFGCLHIFAQIVDAVQVSVVFTGTKNAAGDRADGTLQFVTVVNSQFAAQAPPNVMSGTTEVSAFAQKES